MREGIRGTRNSFFSLKLGRGVQHKMIVVEVCIGAGAVHGRLGAGVGVRHRRWLALGKRVGADEAHTRAEMRGPLDERLADGGPWPRGSAGLQGRPNGTLEQALLFSP
jgi:hypothetical protein